MTAKPKANKSSRIQKKIVDLSKKKTRSTKKDNVTVTDTALSTIIGLAAHEVPGVVGMSPAGLREGIKRILGASQSDEGVVVNRDEKVNVELNVVVAYGVNIPAVADSIKERVYYAAENYAGVRIDDLMIHVAGVSRG